MSGVEMNGVYRLLGNRTISEGIIVSLILQLYVKTKGQNHIANFTAIIFYI